MMPQRGESPFLHGLYYYALWLVSDLHTTAIDLGCNTEVILYSIIWFLSIVELQSVQWGGEATIYKHDENWIILSFHLEEAGCTARLTVQIPTHHEGKLDTNPSEPNTETSRQSASSPWWPEFSTTWDVRGQTLQNMHAFYFSPPLLHVLQLIPSHTSLTLVTAALVSCKFLQASQKYTDSAASPTQNLVLV
jgi:hypothetical protein